MQPIIYLTFIFMGKVSEYFSYKSPGSQVSGSLTNKAKVPSQKELRNKVSGEFLRRKLGEIKFKDGAYQGLGLRKRIEQIYGKRGYAKTSEYQFTEELRKAGVEEKERIKIKRLWRSAFAKQEQEDQAVSPEKAKSNVIGGRLIDEQLNKKNKSKQSGEAIIKGIKESADYTALGIQAPKHQVSIGDPVASADDYPGKSRSKIGIGSKTADKPLGVASGLGAMNQPTDKFNNKPLKGMPPIGFR